MLRRLSPRSSSSVCQRVVDFFANRVQLPPAGPGNDHEIVEKRRTLAQIEHHDIGAPRFSSRASRRQGEFQAAIFRGGSRSITCAGCAHGRNFPEGSRSRNRTNARRTTPYANTASQRETDSVSQYESVVTCRVRRKRRRPRSPTAGVYASACFLFLGKPLPAALLFHLGGEQRRVRCADRFFSLGDFG